MKRRVWEIFTENRGWFQFFADSRAEAEDHCQCLTLDGWVILTKPKMVGWKREGELL